MKKIYTLLMIALIPVAAMAQMPPTHEGTGKYTYINVVQASKLKASEIKDRMLKYGKEETNLTGKEKKWELAESSDGKVKFNATMTVVYPGTKGGTSLTGQIAFTVEIGAKEGKFRYIITDFVHTEARGSGGKLELEKPDCGTTKLLPLSWKKIKILTNSQIRKLIVDIKRVIKEYENDPSRNDDW